MATRRLVRYLLLVICPLVAVAAMAQRPLDVPMDRGLVTVKLLFGMEDKEPSTWEGTYRVTEGRIIATDGWRFMADDYATVSGFKLEVRRFYPRFWNRRGRDESTLPIEPNGLVLTLADLTRASVLEVSTSQGDFTVPVGTIGYGGAQRALERNVEFQRLPTYRQIVKAPTEDGYPAAVAGPDGELYVAYLAFTHGEGFRSRPPIQTMPEDLSFLGVPTDGEQLMFTEMQADQWAEPTALTEPGGDLFRPAIAVDGGGRVWVFWSANGDENWDILARVRAGGEWSDPVRVTSAAGSDFNAATATDSEGRVWLAWQSLGEKSSDIYAVRQEGNGFGEPMAVARTEANEWTPAIAASADGRVAVAWDTYGRGNYDVLTRAWRGGKWETERLIAGTLANELRASAAFDAQNRLWVTYEVSSEGWGKDWGPYDQSPDRTALYQQREVGVKVLAGDALYEPEGDVRLALPMPDGRQRGPNSAERFLLANPKVAVAEDGRIWFSARVRITRFDSQVGGAWLNFLTTPDEDGWRTAFVVPGTDGFLHESATLVPAPDSGMYLVSTSDGRFRTAAFFGSNARQARQRSEGVPPATTRAYGTYPDWQFNQEISVADTGPVRPPDGDYGLVAASAEGPAGPSPAAREEAEQVAGMRGYRAEIGGRSLRPWRGEFHRHTEISGDGTGDGSAFDMWRYGMDTASLDWIGFGDHDNGGGREFSWWLSQKTTSLFQMAGVFTPMYTYERSNNYPDGHRNAVFAQRGVRPLARLRGGMGKDMDELGPDAERPSTPDTQMFYKYLHFFDGVCASHTSGTDMGTDWRDNDPKVEPVVEIYQGCRQSYERPGGPRTNSAEYSLGAWRPFGFVSRALMKGYRLGFQSSSDHVSTHMSYCNVWVEEPTREAIIEAMRQRHVYGATDNIIADVRCGEQFMGDEFTVNKPPVVKVKLVGSAPFAEVVIVQDNEIVYSTQPNEKTVEFEWAPNDLEPGKTSYYYIRGTQVGETDVRKVRSQTTGEQIDLEFNNGEIVWVSPMWITYQPG